MNINQNWPAFIQGHYWLWIGEIRASFFMLENLDDWACQIKLTGTCYDVDENSESDTDEKEQKIRMPGLKGH